MRCWVLLLLFLPFAAIADELSINAGYGSQAHSRQHNWGGGIDWEFWRYARSDRQFFSIGTSYTHLKTDAATNTELKAFSLYPQLTLLAGKRAGWTPYFFVRALGPTFLSRKELGTRKQGERFAFQAQVGIGLVTPSDDWLVALSYKHFSNAQLFSPNESIDLPLLLTIGRRW
jgi:hypothetical protein